MKKVLVVRAQDPIKLQEFLKTLVYPSSVDFIYHDGKDHVAWVQTAQKVKIENKEQRID